MKADFSELGHETESVDSERNRRKRDGGKEAINLVWGWTDEGEGCVCVCVRILSFNPVLFPTV